MDNRLKFLYYRYSLNREVGTQGDKLSEQLEELVQEDIDNIVGKSAMCFETLMGREIRVLK